MNAGDEGYVRCVCGEWAVGLHQACRALLTEEQIHRWSGGDYEGER